MIRLSIIIPFYGVEPFIRQCLSSVFDQDIPEDEYEVICVNDCSLDQSEKIVLEYQSLHHNLILIRHEVNKRLGASRNTGLSHAKGRYVWFVDSDDYIKENCLAELLGICEKNRLDILHWSIQDNQGKWIKQLSNSRVINGINEIKDSWGSPLFDITFPWNRLYSREFLLSNHLWFNDLWGGDVIHTILALNAAKRLVNSSSCFYIYRVDNFNSDMRSPLNAHKVYAFIIALGKAVRECGQNDVSNEISSIISECGVWRLNQCPKVLMRLPLSEKKVFFRIIQKHPEEKKYAIQFADMKVKLVLLFPGLVYFMHPFYRIASIIKHRLHPR